MRRIWIYPLLMLAVALAACGTSASTAVPTTAPAVSTPTTAPVVAAPTAAPAATGFEDSFRTMSYDQIAAAKGQTVNWYMWGGDDSMNKCVNGYLAQQLKETYGITIKQVPVKDTVEVVNKVALQDLPWKTYVLSPRFGASQSHAPKATHDYLGRKTGRTLQGFLMR